MKRIIIAMTLVLALVLSCAAFAESNESTDQVLAEQIEQTAPVEPEEAEPDDEAEPAAPAEEAKPAETNDGLREAMDALRDARISAREEELQAELDGYVADGKLNQEQADLIMNAFTEKQDAGKGNCDCKQMPGRQGGKGRGMQGNPRMPGNQCPNQQGGQFPGNPGRQFPGNQGSSQMPGQQMPGNRMPDNQMPGQQFPGPQGGNHR